MMVAAPDKIERPAQDRVKAIGGTLSGSAPVNDDGLRAVRVPDQRRRRCVIGPHGRTCPKTRQIGSTPTDRAAHLGCEKH